MTVISIAEACRQAWVSGRVERIAAVADGLRFSHGLDFAQVHSTFVVSTGIEIPLADFDEIMQLADDGFTGTIAELSGKGN